MNPESIAVAREMTHRSGSFHVRNCDISPEIPSITISYYGIFSSTWISMGGRGEQDGFLKNIEIAIITVIQDSTFSRSPAMNNIF